MTDLKQAAKMALEALNLPSMKTQAMLIQRDEAITVLREALEREHAMHDLARLGQEIEQEPTPWRDMIVASLVREGIDKHRARELADHFAAQRPWVGLTPEEVLDLFDINNVYGSKWIEFARTVEAKLKDKNT